jgi:hypothetical protein
MRNSNTKRFLTLFQYFQPKINNANLKRNPKPKSYFDAFVLVKVSQYVRLPQLSDERTKIKKPLPN